MWLDNTRMVMPTSVWHKWFEGEPDDDKGREDCAVMSNYRFWSIRKLILPGYVWKDYNCHINPQEIQGYVCESKYHGIHATRV